MKTRKEIASLSALLATRYPSLNPERIAEDALKLSRFAAAATTNATALCKGDRDQAAFDKKKASIEKRADAIAKDYGLRAVHTGDPRGFCLRLLALPGSAPLRGNTWGGDESGYGI